MVGSRGPGRVSAAKQDLLEAASDLRGEFTEELLFGLLLGGSSEVLLERFEVAFAGSLHGSTRAGVWACGCETWAEKPQTW
jgi:hypothetical protein